MITRKTRRAALATATAVTLAATLAAVAPLADAAVYSNGSKTATFDVTLKIIADCTISATALDFGQSQGVLASTVTVNSQLSVTCTNTTPYNVGLNAGTGTGSTTSARVMSGTGANTGTVAFNLYQTAGATNWGNTQGTDTRSGTGTGTAQTLTVYGSIPAQATPQPDTYKSTITATVYF
ncbi:spore coat protein U [Duganella sp. Leaf126]|uniref:Csu type fimbrial protein n=1 Tax=Duganella sp. Leaf126 TaxID=1736266 RepID=UPI0006F2267D|nr:spore coat U domain-containing protein [Duganella sp. Leaf126]KQQ32994.1 spore coat protein U [Duganella sp. Leaf126]